MTYTLRLRGVKIENAAPGTTHEHDGWTYLSGIADREEAVAVALFVAAHHGEAMIIAPVTITGGINSLLAVETGGTFTWPIVVEGRSS